MNFIFEPLLYNQSIKIYVFIRIINYFLLILIPLFSFFNSSIPILIYLNI